MSKTLLIDRNIAQGTILADTIKGQAYEVDVVHSVEEAEAIFKRETFDAVVLDVSFEAEAKDAVKRVRESAAAASEKRTPLIVVTKNFGESSFLLDSGEVDVLLEYPAHVEQLRQVVEQFVGC
ncbi:response regulator receiver protein [Solidesulfovibrio fructosivorans JJ]]|uniref:Response regulator receiver protein n=1 Tax=Solidesulfovibrio fructosivorans JJ] TaxID=596151 RepID=E1JTK3_SOLFR|nr:response regulator [Solidesulfovibrio fructosivorans]EFL52463.1 response regulator receiver protein [Solidesulfovibrio fructosivorans JJ]]